MNGVALSSTIILVRSRKSQSTPGQDGTKSHSSYSIAVACVCNRRWHAARGFQAHFLDASVIAQWGQNSRTAEHQPLPCVCPWAYPGSWFTYAASQQDDKCVTSALSPVDACVQNLVASHTLENDKKKGVTKARNIDQTTARGLESTGSC